MSVIKIKKILEKIVNKIYLSDSKGAQAIIMGGSPISSMDLEGGSLTNPSWGKIFPRHIETRTTSGGTTTVNVIADYDYSIDTKYYTHKTYRATETSGTTSKITIYPYIGVKQSGLYLITANVYFNTGFTAEDRLYLAVIINGEYAGLVSGDNRLWMTERISSTTYQTCNLSRVIGLQAGDDVRLCASNYTAARGSVYPSNTTQLSLTKIL